jgi:1,4-alpha-glucan branching enzyme
LTLRDYGHPIRAMRKLFIGLLAFQALCGVPARAQNDHVAEITFRISAPGASTVEVIGDFNSWQPGSHLLRKMDGSDAWSATFRVDAGMRRIEYQFLVDGCERLVNPEQPVVADDFGGKNNVRLLP